MAETALAVSVTIEASALSHRYGRSIGLAPVSFQLDAPGIVAVTGPNGGGKSTLMRILAGLLRPSGGSVHVARDGIEWPADARRLSVGFISPDITLYEEMSVFENLQFAAQARDLESPGSAVERAIEQAQLQPRAHDRVGALSSGWRQRSRLAFALLGDPELLLFDEPGSHLDEAGRAVIEAVATTSARNRLVIIATNEEREWSLGERRIDLAGGLGRPR